MTLLNGYANKSQSIIKLLNCCPKLTHLSLTGVTAFLREDLEKFCRDAPAGKMALLTSCTKYSKLI